MLKILSFAVFTLIDTVSCISQTTVQLTINHEMNGAPFVMNQITQNNMGHELKINRLEYYLTRFTLLHDGGMTTQVDDSIVALVNANSLTSIYLGNFSLNNIEGIRFHVGVHTPTNHEDIANYPVSHPLGPKSPSMHWGWTSGYRFIALEGKSSTQFDQTVQLHGLGDVNYLETEVATTATISGSTATINVYANYSRGLEDIPLSSGIIYHGVDQEAAQMISNFNNYVFSGTSQVGIAENSQSKFKVYPIPSKSEVHLTWENQAQITEIQITDILGKQVLMQTVEGKTNLDVNITTPGTYLVHFISASGIENNTKISIQ